MLKLVGGLMITAAASAVGFGISGRLNKRVSILRRLCTAIEIMRVEILTRSTPVQDLFQRLGEEMDGAVARLFRNAWENMRRLGDCSLLTIWRKALENTPELMLSEDEQSALSDLGHVLGRYASQEQAAILDYTARRFDAFLAAAVTQRDKKGPVSVAFGLASGLLVLILIL